MICRALRFYIRHMGFDSMITSTWVHFKEQNFKTAKDFVNYLLVLFELENIGYTSAVLWRRDAFQLGKILIRKHRLYDDFKTLLILTHWRDSVCFAKYKEENYSELAAAKCVIEKHGGFVYDFSNVNYFSYLNIIDEVIFNKYRAK